MKHLLIVYHSQSGATAALVDAAARGAGAQADVRVRQLSAFEAGLADLQWADGVLFGSPENFGYLSGALKDFFDRTFYPAQPAPLNLPYMALISAGNDGSGAVRQLEKILRGYPMKKVNEALIVVGKPTAADLAGAEELGAGFAAGLTMGIF